MSITHPRTLAVTVVIITIAAVLTALFVHPDFYPSLHTYGVSVGSDSHYCSLELVRWHLSLTCESAR